MGNLGFSLVSQSTICHERPHGDGICCSLDDAAFRRKMAAANEYAELAGEVQAALERTSMAALRMECLRPVNSGADGHLCGQIPFYESYGAKQVAAGHYHRVLRYEDDIAPLAGALRRYAEGKI